MASNLLRDFLADGLVDLEELEGSPTMFFNGRDIPCSAGSLEKGVVIDIGGNPVETALVLFVRRTLVPTWDDHLITFDDTGVTFDDERPPKSGEIVKYPGENGIAYQVLTIKGAVSHYEITVVDLHSGRKR